MEIERVRKGIGKCGWAEKCEDTRWGTREE